MKYKLFDRVNKNIISCHNIDFLSEIIDINLIENNDIIDFLLHLDDILEKLKTNHESIQYRTHIINDLKELNEHHEKADIVNILEKHLKFLEKDNYFINNLNLNLIFKIEDLQSELVHHMYTCTGLLII
jgi:hypothetical protein